MTTFPTKSELLQNFSNCTNWEEKYMYIIHLGKLLPTFPNNLRTHKYSITGCQSHTWIALIPSSVDKSLVKFHGYSDASIVKGIIVIIFGLYQKHSIQEVITLDVISTLRQIKLQENLTTSRSQGIFFILNAIHIQSNILYKQQSQSI